MTSAVSKMMCRAFARRKGYFGGEEAKHRKKKGGGNKKKLANKGVDGVFVPNGGD